MDAKEESRPQKALRSIAKGTLRLLLVLLLLVLLTAFLWWSGLLPRYVLPYVIEQAAGVRISFRSDGFTPLYLRDLQVRDPDADPAKPPLLQVEVLQLDWHPGFLLPDRTLLEAVQLTNARIHLDATDPDKPNYAFLLKRGSGMDVSALLPKTIRVSGLSVSATMPDGNAQVEGIDAVFSMESLERFSADIEGGSVLTSWQGAAGAGAPPVPKGSAKATVRREGQSFNLDANVDLPGFLVVKGTAALELADTVSFDAQLERVQTEGPVLTELLSPLLPLPVAFDSLALVPARLQGTFSNRRLALSESTLDARIEGLRIGEPDAPWYEGPLRVEAQGAYETAARATFTATLNREQSLSGTVTQADAGVDVAVQFEDWDKAQVLSVWPPLLESVRVCLDHLARASGAVTLGISPEAVSFETKIAPDFEEDLRTRLNAQGRYVFEEGLSLSGAYEAGKGRLGMNAAYAPGTSITLTANAEAMPAAALTVLLPTSEPLDADIPLNGTFRLEGKPGADSKFEADLTSTRARLAQWTVPKALARLKLEATGTIPADFSVIAIDSATLKMGESTSFTLTKSGFTLADKELRGTLAAAGEIEPLAGMFGIADVWGTFSGEGKMTVTEALLVRFRPASLVLEPLGYGDYTLPYGQPLNITADADVNVLKTAVHLKDLRAALGDGTTLEAAGMRLSPGVLEAPGAMKIKTDFAPVVAKGYLASATGTLETTLQDFRRDAKGIAGQATYACTASDLALPDNMAVFSGVSVQGAAALQPEPAGQGDVAIETLRAAGIAVEDVKGVLHTRGEVVTIEEVVFTLFRGTVDAHIEARPFEPGLPFKISGEVKDLDLDTFTKEFKPESFVLTGKVNGTFSVGMAASKLTAFDVDLQSNEDFSMNRAAVEQLLMRQYMGDMAGGKKMQRMVQDVIGEDEQRKFDSAATKLGLEEGRITGDVKLTSKKLNLTLDVKADPGALLEALRIRQGERE